MRALVLFLVGLFLGLLWAAQGQTQGPDDRTMILVEPCERESGKAVSPGEVANCSGIVDHAGTRMTFTFPSQGCGAQHTIDLTGALGLARVYATCTDHLGESGEVATKDRQFLGDRLRAPELLD